MRRKILVPIDRTASSEQAFEAALALADGAPTTITLLSVEPPVRLEEIEEAVRYRLPIWEYRSTLERVRHDDLAQLSKRHARPTVTFETVVRFGKPSEEIVAHVENNDFDLIVMVTQPRSGLDRLIHGSVTDDVINGTTIPVLIVRPTEVPQPVGAV